MHQHHERATRHVTVGFDGSAGSRTALRYAVEEARRRSVPLRVVTIWDVPPLVGVGVVLPSDFAEMTAEAARKTAQSAIDELGETDVAIELVVAGGSPSGTLVRESRSAEALVVGSRGHGAFTDLLIGSVSRACTQYASCPVIVVPHDWVVPAPPVQSFSTWAV